MAIHHPEQWPGVDLRRRRIEVLRAFLKRGNGRAERLMEAPRRLADPPRHFQRRIVLRIAGSNVR